MTAPGQIPLFGNPNKFIDTVAKPELLQLSVGRKLSVGPLNQNIKWILYARALKVFRMSFAGYDQISLDYYNQKYAEYRYSMGQLYNIDINDPSLADIDATITNHLETEQYITNISVLRLRTPALIPNIWVQIAENYSPTQRQTTEHKLNSNSDEQTINVTRYHSYRSYVDRRLDNTSGIRLTVQTQTIHYGTFYIGFRQISAYGFRDWIQFSHGVELFVEIEVSGYIEEQGSTDEFIYYFHMQTLYEMLNERLNHWRNNIQLLGLKCEPEHRNDSQKYQTVIVKPLIDPNTTAAYWVDSQAHTNVELWDLQTAYIRHNKTIDSVCLCDRWCNWTAFFHYSPIYRFLLLCHKQIYLSNWTHITNMYVMVSAFCTTLRGQRLLPTDQLPPTPIYRLLNDAIDYKEQYVLLITSTQLSINQYRTAIPIPREMVGLAYNILRFETDWVAQVQQLYDNHFTHECVDMFCQLGLAFGKIHEYVAQISIFVDKRTQYEPFCEQLNEIIRNHCLKYLTLAGDRIIQRKITGTDWLFSEDLKYNKRLPKTPKEEFVWNCRSMVLRHDGPDSNPLMVSTLVSPLLNVFCAVYLFNGWTETVLTSGPETEIEAILSVQQSKYLDKLLINNLINVKPPQLLTYQLSGQQLIAKGVQHMKRQLMVVYMLRIYHMAYEWQREAIVLLENKNDFNISNDREEPCEAYSKIFDINYLEFYCRIANHTPLFEINSNQLDTNFNEFYNTYWPKAVHETNQKLNNTQIQQSVISEYNKLYHWLIYRGDSRLKFRRIVNWIDLSIENVRQNSHQILNNHIMSTINDMQNTYEYSVDILDYVVYYLVKAQCFVIVCIVNQFLSKLISLQTPAIFKTNRQFSLCKPGWVPMFRTVDTVRTALDSILADNIIYDDECQRIAGTVDETKELIRLQFEQYYRKLVNQWTRELKLLRNKIVQTVNTNPLIRLHLAVGLGFMAAFVNTFRSTVNDFRKLLLEILDGPISANRPVQAVLQNLRPTCLKYLENVDTVLEALPLIRQPWDQELESILNDFATNTTKQSLGIDLEESNT
ncbi:uncharacterized protein LOC128964819 [Oppia nitens]|uniref:uncharacterized protein LOC128964819 n=1 Tax=Oppia nitens TaxID=1686743 RepID=UPI0023D9B794|nr:uncharacterized protein LOC128964819 [Oppia nitens]